MKIICILGSPRRGGNSAAIVKKFCETVKRDIGDAEKNDKVMNMAAEAAKQLSGNC